MPYETNWYIENRVVSTRLEGEITQQEMLGNSDAIEQLVLSAPAPVMLVVDLRDVAKVNYSLNRGLQGLNPGATEGKIEWILLISTSRLYNFFGTMASQFFSVPMRVFATLEDADGFIAHQASELA